MYSLTLFFLSDEINYSLRLLIQFKKPRLTNDQADISSFCEDRLRFYNIPP